MEVIQLPNEAIDVADWKRHEEFAAYPEGARDKTLLYAPSPPPHNFLRSEHRYLFKLSSPRYAEQFWVEIFAYRLSQYMDIIVPPAFVAYDSKQHQCGALIEWYLNQSLSDDDISLSGGDLCQVRIPNFDRKKGKEHNFETIASIFEALSKIKTPDTFQTDWKSYWAKTFIFDCLIGNTDRHQDNWSIIASANNNIRISPVFDNGTSMGHEIFPAKFNSYDDANRLEKYIAKGKHHMKWKLSDTSRISHFELINKFIQQYPKTRETMLSCLRKVNIEIFQNILNDLVAFAVPIRLSRERADFMLKLLQARYQRLLSELEK